MTLHMDSEIFKDWLLKYLYCS